MDQEKTKVWAHRGASGYAPENTLDAFRKAVEMGADGIELDVQMTKDGELVVIHDETIDRVSNGKGWVKDYTYEELKKFNFNKTHLEYTKEEIPTLEQVYRLIKPTNLTINVEIKTGIVFYPGIEERVLELTERLGMKERVIYSSFNHYTIRKIKELDPQAKTGMLYEDGIIDAVDYACDVVKADALHPAGYNVLYPGFLDKCLERNRQLHVWTINEEKDMRMLCEAGVDAMITNYPDIAKKIRDEYRFGELQPELVQKNPPELRMREKHMTEKRAENIMIPEEANYQRTMKCDVEPYLRNCEKDGYIESYDKTAIYYRTYRIPQAKAGIVISHGFCEFAEKYEEVIYYFLKNGYSVYVPEHRGHGYSDRIVVDGEKVHVEDYEQYVQDLHFFVKNVVEPTEKRKILFCHSMGGAIGVRYLEEFPLTFDAAILSAPMLGMNTGKYPKWLAKVTADFFCAIGKGTKYAAGQSGFSDKPSFETSSCVSRERYMYIYNMRLRNINYQTYGGTYAWVKAGFKVTRKLRKRKNINSIKIPLIIFEAEKDDMVDNCGIEKFAKKAKTAQLVRMKDSKHEIFNAGEAVRDSYYRQIFLFLNHVYTAQERMNEENEYETKTDETRKILGTV